MDTLEHRGTLGHGYRVIYGLKNGMVPIDVACDKCGEMVIGRQDDIGPHGWLILCLNKECSRSAQSQWMPMDHEPHPIEPKKRLRKYVQGTRCEICRRDEVDLPDKISMHVHHVQPRRAGGQDNDDNLRLYCKSCHELVHTIRRMHQTDDI